MEDTYKVFSDSLELAIEQTIIQLSQKYTPNDIIEGLWGALEVLDDYNDIEITVNNTLERIAEEGY